MNPFVNKHLDDIHERLDALTEVLRSTQARADRADTQRSDVLEAQLKQRKELVTLQHKATAYDTLKAEKEHLKTTQAALHERLRKILAFTKALGAELRS